MSNVGVFKFLLLHNISSHLNSNILKVLIGTNTMEEMDKYIENKNIDLKDGRYTVVETVK